ncbi:DUF1145 domain-containing protein [Pseudomonas sp. No.21]|jgi:putative membrane protein|uniref:DUF1145 domain-containing protein n=1 Tax=Pseudomonas tohonis TaxID=2725477 RepID=A0A6J4E239_9PSED|nr:MULTISPECIES: DUF1145 domain-containing protein [Pseudomonas]MDW3711746.1 DUF1145 domain-containing protein [Pseudomonas sp. 2023EL-01195]PZE13913.1 hypothetical protein DMX10_07810 [Pseudomonas sp. 57B-090624]BBP81737.1 hypothetical protein PHLH8_13790 [Pseudomonas sp. Pc102]BCG23286.1 hypothetical protein TUM18999_14770 [Pseudomonas tohonis]GJN45166.1 hypothetical protein TUM20249_11520 [Pseudomonas tohonis]
MKLFLGVGKLVALVFWLAVLANLIEPFAKPFASLLNAVAALVLGLHLLELVVCNGQLRTRPRPWNDRLQLLLFGVFHLLGLPRSEGGRQHA